MLSTDPAPNTFDMIVGYDAGIDHIASHYVQDTHSLTPILEGAMYTRPQHSRHLTALMLGGSKIHTVEELYRSTLNLFWKDYRISVLVDPKGAYTTASSLVSTIVKEFPDLFGHKVSILNGTGPVGITTAKLLSLIGAEVCIVGSDPYHTEHASSYLNGECNLNVDTIVAQNEQSRFEAIRNSFGVISAGHRGLNLISTDILKKSSDIKFIADYNSTEPYGISKIKLNSLGERIEGIAHFGPIGIGRTKLSLQKNALRSLFEDYTRQLDLSNLYNFALSTLHG